MTFNNAGGVHMMTVVVGCGGDGGGDRDTNCSDGSDLSCCDLLVTVNMMAVVCMLIISS